jgi:hypothetical protein
MLDIAIGEVSRMADIAWKAQKKDSFFAHTLTETHARLKTLNAGTVLLSILKQKISTINAFGFRFL